LTFPGMRSGAFCKVIRLANLRLKHNCEFAEFLQRCDHLMYGNRQESKQMKIGLANPFADRVRTDPTRREALRAALADMSDSVIRNVYPS